MKLEDDRKVKLRTNGTLTFEVGRTLDGRLLWSDGTVEEGDDLFLPHKGGDPHSP